MFGVPISGITIVRASVRQFILRDKLVGLARPDHELAPAAIADFAANGTVKEAVFQPFDHDVFEMREGFSDLAAVR
ncbi:MAG: hypothetical protein U1E42_09440 [Rhodospirillales bacterium]